MWACEARGPISVPPSADDIRKGRLAERIPASGRLLFQDRPLGQQPVQEEMHRLLVPCDGNCAGLCRRCTLAAAPACRARHHPTPHGVAGLPTACAREFVGDASTALLEAAAADVGGATASGNNAAAAGVAFSTKMYAGARWLGRGDRPELPGAPPTTGPGAARGGDGEFEGYLHYLTNCHSSVEGCHHH